MRNPCKECDYYHKENNTCQSKKCCTGGDGYISWIDRLFCKPYKYNADRKTENSSEKLNNCEEQTDWHYDEQDATWYPYKHEDEPQTELVNDSPILVKDLVDDEFNPYDEECMRCKHLKLQCEFVPSYCKYEPRDEPQNHSGEATEMVKDKLQTERSE